MAAARKPTTTTRKPAAVKPVPVEGVDFGDAPIGNPDGSPVITELADEPADVEGSA
jgi:hypothetical protein